MRIRETDTEITGEIILRDYDQKKGTGMFYITSELYEKIKHLKDQDLKFRFVKENDEICIKPHILEY
jgi:hypothetical protein